MLLDKGGVDYEKPTHVTVAPRPIDASNTVLGKALAKRGIEI